MQIFVPALDNFFFSVNYFLLDFLLHFAIQPNDSRAEKFEKFLCDDSIEFYYWLLTSLAGNSASKVHGQVSINRVVVGL